MSLTTITVLCENRAGGLIGITGEHGFAALIEKDDRKILLDTGQGMTLKTNADALGKPLSQVSTVVISHGHYDHTGGLPQVLAPPRGVEIIAHPDIFTEKYAQLPSAQGPLTFHIGIRFQKAFLEGGLGARFNFQTRFTEISPGIFFSGEVPRVTDFERPDSMLKVKQGDVLVDDPLLDDASLLIETDSGPVILTGCAHAGIVNTMEHFREKTGHTRFHAVIGGTHLGFMGISPQLEKSLDAFERFGVDLIAVSHCTGNEAAAICYNRFKDRFAFANAGWTRSF
ncbi:MAG: MBL fold metallo-hydrolase [Pseudomonadota bacterium]